MECQIRFDWFTLQFIAQPYSLTHPPTLPDIHSFIHPFEWGRQERLLGPSDWAGGAQGLREEPGSIVSYHWHSESKYTLQHSHTRLHCPPCPRTKPSQSNRHPPHPHHTALCCTNNQSKASQAPVSVRTPVSLVIWRGACQRGQTGLLY